MSHMVDAVGGFFAGFDDDTPARLKARPPGWRTALEGKAVRIPTGIRFGARSVC